MFKFVYLRLIRWNCITYFPPCDILIEETKRRQYEGLQGHNTPLYAIKMTKARRAAVSMTAKGSIVV